MYPRKWNANPSGLFEVEAGIGDYLTDGPGVYIVNLWIVDGNDEYYLPIHRFVIEGS